MKILFCIVGRSATGKDTLTNAICRDLQMEKVVSHTTREPRAGEKEGINYYFSAAEQLFAAEDAQNIAASTKIGNNYYWTTKDEILGKDFYVIDPEGLESLRANIKNENIRLVSIYITAPTLEREKRALLRDPQNIKKYLNKCEAEDAQFSAYEHWRPYDYCVHNAHFESALEQLKTIINKEKENIYAI